VSRFRDLRERFKFYWVQLPVHLFPAEGMPFTKLECAVEFNPTVIEGHLRPTAYMIFPDRKFKKLLEFSDHLQVDIGQDDFVDQCIT